MKLKTFSFAKAVSTLSNLLALTFLFYFSCKDNVSLPPEQEPPVAVWQSLDLKDKPATLVLSEPYLYACAGNDGLWRKNLQTSGSEWEFLGLGKTGRYGLTTGAVQDVVISVENPDWILAATRDIGPFRSLDGGNTWTLAGNGLEYFYGSDTLFNIIYRFLQYPSYIIGTSSGAIYRTDDFANSWVPISSNGPGGFLDAIANHNLFPNIIWMGGTGWIEEPFLQKSIDSGIKWQDIEIDSLIGDVNGVNSIAFDPENSDITYVGCDDEIIATTDGGRTWKKLFASGAWAILVDPRNSSHLWAASLDIKPFETWDAGVTWLPMKGEIPLTSRVTDMVWDEKREIVYVATNTGVYSFEQ